MSSIFSRGKVRAAQIAPTQVGSQHMAMSAVLGGSIPTFTTTNTADWQDIVTVDFEVVNRKCHLYVPVTTHVKHSVGGATFGFRASLYDVDKTSGALSNGLLFYLIDNIILPATAGAWYLLAPVVAGSLDFDQMDHGEGRHRLVLQLRNYTAGTLETTDPGVRTSTLLVGLFGKAL